MADEDGVYRSLELAAETVGDIVPTVFERYYRDCPDAAELMSHMDQHMQGRMLDEVLRLVMTENYADDDVYLNYEVKNHRLSYGVQNSMYPALFAAVQGTVRDAVGARWSEEFESAWQHRLQSLLAEIEARAA